MQTLEHDDDLAAAPEETRASARPLPSWVATSVFAGSAVLVAVFLLRVLGAPWPHFGAPFPESTDLQKFARIGTTASAVLVRRPGTVVSALHVVPRSEHDTRRHRAGRTVRRGGALPVPHHPSGGAHSSRGGVRGRLRRRDRSGGPDRVLDHDDPRRVALDLVRVRARRGLVACRGAARDVHHHVGVDLDGRLGVVARPECDRRRAGHRSRRRLHRAAREVGRCIAAEKRDHRCCGSARTLCLRRRLATRRAPGGREFFQRLLDSTPARSARRAPR